MFTAMLAASLLAPAADLGEAAKKELKKLEGEWTVVAMAQGGESRELPVDEQMAVTIAADGKFTAGKLDPAQITALDTTATPKILDFQMLRKPPSGATNEAVYKIEKDKLTVVVYLGEGNKRPSGFDVPTDTTTIRFVLERVKK